MWRGTAHRSTAEVCRTSMAVVAVVVVAAAAQWFAAVDS